MIYLNKVKNEKFKIFSDRKNLLDESFVKAQLSNEFIIEYDINFNQINNKY